MNHKVEIEQYLTACKCNEEVKAIVLKIDNYMSNPGKIFEFGFANSKNPPPRNIYYAIFSKKRNNKSFHLVSLVPHKNSIRIKIKIGIHIIEEKMPDLIETLEIKDVSYQYKDVPSIEFHLHSQSQLNYFYTLLDFVYKYYVD